MTTCRKCGGEVRLTALGWGHAVNPGPRHHYVRVLSSPEPKTSALAGELAMTSVPSPRSEPMQRSGDDSLQAVPAASGVRPRFSAPGGI